MSSQIKDSEIPGGTVTFLFTDIEGSTRLLERLHEQYAMLLEQHHTILRDALGRWNGHEIDTQGDAFFVAFTHATDAIKAVVDAQRELAAHTWPLGATVCVRMGLHTGEPIIARTGYVGMDVHRAARIAHAGHGGQVLISQTTRELIYQDLTPGISLRNLGEFKLKDIRFPQNIFQLDIEGLPTDFPQLKTMSAAEEPPTPGEAPYKGLQYFDEPDAGWFFGREQVTAWLVEAIQNQHFLAVIGASGSGKSSVVRAGLVPALKSNQAGRWQVYVLTPTAHPLESLAVCLTRNSESVTVTSTLIDDLRLDVRSLHLYTQKNLTPTFSMAGRGRILLVIDQFEELFTQCREPVERQAFVDNLLEAANNEVSSTHVLITLRADFYEHIAQYPELRKLVSTQQLYIGPMSAEELRQAIEEPARRGGWELSPGLSDLILHDIGAGGNHQPEPGALPLLSHALLETWKRRRGNLMNLRAYTEAGGVRGAIAHTADSVFNQELTAEQQEIARNIFLRLTELGEGTQDTRRRISILELIPPGPALETGQIRTVLLKLADARLITTGEDTVEVAHEALIREWPALREWLSQDREGLRLHRHLTEAAQEWKLLECDPGALYRGARLAQALEWALNNPRQLNQQEQAFLNASQETAEQEAAEREAARQRELEAAQKLAETEHQRAEEQAHSARRLRQRAVYLFAALVIALGLAMAALFFFNRANQNARLATEREVEAVKQRQVAEEQTRLTRSRELALASINNLDQDPELSILMALQAIYTTRSVDGVVLPEAQEALHQSILSSRVRMTLTGHEDWLLSTDFSPDGSRVATIERDGTTILWNAANGDELLRLPGNTKIRDEIGTQRLAFSPDGRRLATTDNNLVKIWGMPTGEELLKLSGHTADVWAVAFSPNGEFLATGGMDAQARIWDIKTGESLLTLTGHQDAIECLAFSPDGKLLATGSDDNTLKIWDVTSGKLVHDITDFSSPVDSLAFSPDGRRMAASSSGTIKVWMLDSGITGEPLTIQENAGSVIFSPDGTQLAAVSGNGARLWDARNGRELLTLAGHNDWVMDLAFSPDGKQVVTASADGTAKLWNITPGVEVISLLSSGNHVVYSPDGALLATDGLDGAVKIWNAITGEEQATLSGHTDSVIGVAFSPDSKRLGTASIDHTAKVWDISTGQQLFSLIGHTFFIRDIAYSPDGKWIATAGFDQTARVWDAMTGEEVLQLPGHEALVTGVAFSPDGTRLATASTDTTAKVWDVHTGQLLFTLKGHSGPIPDITFSPDGKWLATGSRDTTAKIWDASSGSEILTLASHSSEIQSVAFSNDGKLIATGSGDNTAKIWDASTGQVLQTLPGSLGGVTGVAFSPDDSRLAVASADGIVRVMFLGIDEVIALAQSRLTRTFSEVECREYRIPVFFSGDVCPSK